VQGLARKEDFDHGEDFTNHAVAQRVNGVLGTPMGTKYGEIVRKCLECEFDVREQDLAKPELQRAFYRDVICEMDDLEAAFKRLDLL
jgi:tetrahydromethanopterin S-methyltransferase subunit G